MSRNFDDGLQEVSDRQDVFQQVGHRRLKARKGQQRIQNSVALAQTVGDYLQERVVAP